MVIPPPARKQGHWQRLAFRAGLVLLGVVLVLGGIMALGPLLQNQLAQQERFQIPFHTLECSAPVGQTTKDFLDEVEYLSGIPDTINLLDPQLKDKLTQAFQKHPQVKQVQRIDILPDKRVRLELQFHPKSTR